MRKTICLMLVIVLLLGLPACASSAGSGGETASAPQSEAANGADAMADNAETIAATGAAAITIEEPVRPLETVPGYISTELDTPDWVSSFGSCEIIGDTFYIIAQTTEGETRLAVFDTLSEEWSGIALEIGQSTNPHVDLLSATEDSVWIIFRDGRTEEEIASSNFTRELGYYLLHIDLSSGVQTWTPVEFWHEGNGYFMSLIALDSGRALLGKGETAVLIDPTAKIIGTPELTVQGQGFHSRIGGRLYVGTADGLAELDPATLQYGEAIEELDDRLVYCSSLGNFLTTKDSALCSVDPVSGEYSKLFSWMDVALSYTRAYGRQGLENSNGDIFHMTDRITKVSKGEVPLRKTLTLACLGDSSDEMYQYASSSYAASDALLDAIVRFNNSDPEFRVEIKPYIYNNEAERDKILIELGTATDIDLLDTSLLPAGAVKGQIFTDLLPYIDADPSISRNDFIESLFNSMIKNGGLYEYTDKFTLLTMYTHPELADEDTWTVEGVKNLLAQNPDAGRPVGREELINIFSWAATAEFIDMGSAAVHFDDPLFAEWLTLLKALTETDGKYDLRTLLFDFSYDLAGEIGFRTHAHMGGDCAVVGFPGASDGGTYFMKLGRKGALGGDGELYHEPHMYTNGCATSLGIMASGQNQQGAWRFMRTFMQGNETSWIIYGIPVLKEGFERAIECELARDRSQERLPYEPFNQADADALRKLVYSTNKLVCAEEAMMDVLREAINAYLGGKGSAEETARQIQGRLSIYMAEQYG